MFCIGYNWNILVINFTIKMYVHNIYIYIILNEGYFDINNIYNY